MLLLQFTFLLTLSVCNWYESKLERIIVYTGLDVAAHVLMACARDSDGFNDIFWFLISFWNYIAEERI